MSGQETLLDDTGLPAEQFHGFMNRIANHEVKLLATAVMLDDAPEPYRPGELRHRLHELQGADRSISLYASQLKQFCDYSLVPSGVIEAVDATDSRGRQVTSYRAAAPHHDAYLALDGFLLDWSLRYPDISLQQVYGGAASLIGVHAPAARHWLYNSLLRHPSGLSAHSVIGEVGDAGYSSKRGVYRLIQHIEDEGIIVKRNKMQYYNPQVRIADADYHHVPTPYDDLIPETRAIYDAMKALAAKGIVDLDTLVRAAAALVPKGDIPKLRSTIVNGLTQGGRLPGLVLADPESDGFRELMVITFDEEYRAAVEAVTLGVDRIAAGQGIAEHGAKVREILSEPAEVASLVQKGRDFSPYVAGREKPALERNIRAIVSSLGGVSLRAVRAELAVSHQRRISRSGLRSVMNGMVTAGTLTVTEKPESISSTRKHNVYSLPGS